MAESTQSVEIPKSKVALSTSTSGVVTWEVRAYHEDMAEAHRIAVEEHDRLVERFGMPEKKK